MWNFRLYLLRAIAAAAALGLAATTGCFKTSGPLETDARKAFEKATMIHSPLPVEVVRFVKTKGEVGDLDGKPVYIFHYEADVRFTVRCLYGVTEGGWIVATQNPSPEFFAEVRNSIKNATAGQQETVTGNMWFTAQGKGWRGPDGEVR